MSVHYTCPNYPKELLGTGVRINQVACQGNHRGPCHEQGWPTDFSDGPPKGQDGEA